MPQTNYSIYQPVGYAGMIATANPQDIHTYTSESSSLIPYGVVVVKGSKDKTAVPASGGNQNAVGVTVFRGDIEANHPVAGYTVNEAMNVVKKGAVYMIAETAVTSESSVFFRHTASGTPAANDGIGRVTGTTSANHAALAGARFKRSAAAGELVEVLLNMP